MACKVVNVCGRRRKLCFGANGKIRSNTAAGGGGRSKGRKHSSSSGRKACQRSNGTLKKGWRYGSSGRCVKAKG